MSKRDHETNKTAVERTMNDLSWLAQRYVLDEMDAGEAAAFETRLADDSEAAAAVAAAVRLIAAVKVSAGDGGLGRLAAAGRDRVSGWLAAAITAIAACVAIVVIPMAVPRRPLRVSLEPAEVVCRWNGFAMDSAVGRGLVAEVERPAVDRLPQWLMAAVAIAGEAVAAEDRN